MRASMNTQGLVQIKSINTQVKLAHLAKRRCQSERLCWKKRHKLRPFSSMKPTSWMKERSRGTMRRSSWQDEDVFQVGRKGFMSLSERNTLWLETIVYLRI